MMPSTSELRAVAHEEGMNWAMFAARFGISEHTARQWCRSVGIRGLGTKKRPYQRI